jgi:hypothetical protein
MSTGIDLELLAERALANLSDDTLATFRHIP